MHGARTAASDSLTNAAQLDAAFAAARGVGRAMRALVSVLRWPRGDSLHRAGASAWASTIFVFTRCRRRARRGGAPRHPDHVRAARLSLVRPRQSHARRADGRPRASCIADRSNRDGAPRSRLPAAARALRAGAARSSRGTSSTSPNGSRRSKRGELRRVSQRQRRCSFTRPPVIRSPSARPACAGAIDTTASASISIRCTGTTALKHQPPLETPVSELGFDRPVLLGEFPTGIEAARPTTSSRTARAAGYAGAFYWSAAVAKDDVLVDRLTPSPPAPSRPCACRRGTHNAQDDRRR